MNKTLCNIIILILIYTTAHSQPGSIDNTFCSGNGIMRKYYENGCGLSIAMQSDSKIIVAGYTGSAPDEDFILVRYNAGGTPDSSFGNGGKVTTDFEGGDDLCNSVVIQTDGKIVVAGYSTSNSTFITSATLARYNLNGTLDNSFGAGGKKTTSFSGFEQAFAVAIQTDGKIVVGGVSNSDPAVFRYNSNGSLDSTFGIEGIWTKNDFWSIIYSVSLQNDGKIVIAGHYKSGSGEFVIARLNSNGTLDNTFGAGFGLMTTDIMNSSKLDYGYSMAIQNDGKFVVAGTTNEGNQSDFALVRYNSDGNLDNTFGLGGMDTTNFGGDDRGYSVSIQTDGKILVTGYTDKGTSNHYYALARYNLNGILDSTFGDDGKLTVTIGSDDWGYATVLQNDGKFVITGKSNGGISFARLMYDGSFDNTFAPDGKVITPYIGIANTVGIQSDGKIVVGGFTASTPADFALIRYYTDGTIDKTFGIKGIVRTNFNSLPSPSTDEGYSMVIQPDGKIILGGGVLNASFNQNFGLARFNYDGTLDDSFGGNGKVIIDHGYSEYGKSVALQSDGKIVIAGYSNYFFYVVRLFSNGDLEPESTFQNCEIGFGLDNRAHSVAIQSDGKIVMGGFVNGYSFALARINSNGGPDSTFGTNGKVITDFGSNNDDKCFSICIQQDGKILAAGNSDKDFALARYNTDGTLDNAFGSGGKVITNFGFSTGIAYSVIPQNDGKVLVGGTIQYDGFSSDFILVRYNIDGSFDNTFGANGSTTLNFGRNGNQGLSVCRSIAIQSDGKIVMAGNTAVQSIALARFNGGNGEATGVQTISQSNNFNLRIFPNPFSYSTTIEIQNTGHKIPYMELKIYNLIGLTVYHKTLNSNFVTLNLNLPSGIYFYKINNEKRKIIGNGKLIIQ